MGSARLRILPPQAIPESLWIRSEEVVCLPPSLAKAYMERIDRLSLRECANARSGKEGPVGGQSKEESNQHFAQAFDGSAARALLAVMDPKGELGETSDAFLKSTAGASLALTDAPCGAGAAALGFLTLIAELRAEGVLPRMPLDVKFIGGELSRHAIDHAEILFKELQPALEHQGIFVDFQFHTWDVCDRLSTTDLVKASAVHGASCTSKLLVIANFNGFLVKERKQKEAQPQIDELLRYASGKQSVAVWIEPNMNAATGSGGLFSWLLGLLQGKWNPFARAAPATPGGAPVFSSVAKFQLPLEPTNTARVTLSVMPIDLTRGSP